MCTSNKAREIGRKLRSLELRTQERKNKKQYCTRVGKKRKEALFCKSICPANKSARKMLEIKQESMGTSKLVARMLVITIGAKQKMKWKKTYTFKCK